MTEARDTDHRRMHQRTATGASTMDMTSYLIPIWGCILLWDYPASILLMASTTGSRVTAGITVSGPMVTGTFTRKSFLANYTKSPAATKNGATATEKETVAEAGNGMIELVT